MDADIVSEALVIADLLSCSTLKKFCIEFIRKHRQEVEATEGWKHLWDTREDLVKEVDRKKAKIQKETKEETNNQKKMDDWLVLSVL